MELVQYTKKELIEMLEATFDTLEFYAKLEISFINGRQFAIPKDRRAVIASRGIRKVQSDAIKRRETKKKGTNV